MSLLAAWFLFFSAHTPDAPLGEAFPPPGTREVSITVAAVGDFLMHMPVVYSVHNPDTGRFEFRRIFEPVQDLFQAADYAIANLETTLAGPERGYSGYPRFNCPADLAAEMRAVGLDMFLTANNHSLDQGAAGVIATIDHLEAAGLDRVGTYRSQEEKDRPFVRDIGGIRLGVMNYTASTNGLPVPANKPYLVNVIDRDEMRNEIAALKTTGADIIIACLHFGEEYSRHPNDAQRDLVHWLFSEGVDIVLGSHPHVVQPTETRTVLKDGVPRKKFAAYSLGNFISNQRWQHADSGLLVNLVIKKDLDTGVTFLADVDLIPIWVHTYHAAGRVQYRVLPVEKTLAASRTDPLLTAADVQRLAQVADELKPGFLSPAELSRQPLRVR
jgi:poly-gamma-glutamate synthesis protein (capsule biosynthesis protein)